MAAEASVSELTEATFDKEIQENVWFVKFYAPWCGHCKKLAPIFDELAAHPELEGTNVRVAKVDCTQERSICERFGVQSYPTLKVITGGKHYDYAGRRELPLMLKYVTDEYKEAFAEEVLTMEEMVLHKQKVAAEQAEIERSSSVVAISSDTFEDLVKADGSTWILKFYAPWCGHCKRLAPTWHRLSKTLKDSGSETRVGKVDCTVHRRVCSRFGVGGYPSLFFVRDGNVYKYKGARNHNAFVEFINSGWEKAESLGPIADESFLSSIMDTTVEWATQNTVAAVVAGIVALAILVGILVTLLDYCLGDDSVSAYQEMHSERAKAAVAKADAKEGTKPKEE